MIMIVLFGPPGVGKGTQAEFISQSFGLSIISTGALLRKLDSKSIVLNNISNGRLVPDDIVSSLLKEQIISNSNMNGYILDGYPRTISQVQFLDKLSENQNIYRIYYIHLYLEEKKIVNRLTSRFLCLGCKKVYNNLTIMPKIQGVCDTCGGQNFFIRDDDNINSINVRLSIYRQETQKIVDTYRGRKTYKKILADNSITTIRDTIFQFLQSN